MIPECKDKKQIYKFGFYGLLKNLRFFDAYLWIYFIISGLSLFHIGILYAVRETIIYVFEVPSGVIADRFGKKNELILCFLFYILSFVMFFFADNIYMFMLAMTLYGFGEAFRSGTHKAMIMEFLDYNKISESKSRIYGLTRSYSNLGSVISGLVGIALIIYTTDISYLFLFAIIPYVLDLLLIMTYPDYLNKRIDVKFNFIDFFKQNLLSIKYAFKTKKINNLIFESAGFNAVFKTIKDYIQPIVVGLGLSLILFSNLTEDDNLRIYLGLIYATAQLVSVFVSRNAYRLQKLVSENTLLDTIWGLTGLTAIILGLFIGNIYIVMAAFILFYVYLNIRKPFMVEKIGDATISEKRASVLSIESQITSLMIIILAPILGFLSDQFGIGVMMISLGVSMLLILIIKPKEKSA